MCAALGSLRGAVGAVDLARRADASGDLAEVQRQMDEVARLVGLARSNLGGTAADPKTAAAATALLEGASYLEFMVADYRSSGRVDFAMTQFASRALNRAASGAGGTPLNC